MSTRKAHRKSQPTSVQRRRIPPETDTCNSKHCKPL